MMENRRAKNIVTGFAIFVIVALVTGIVTLIINLQNQDKPELLIEVSPSTSKVTVNGAPASAGKIRVPEGKVVVRAEHPGFKPAVETIDVSLEDTEPYVGLILTPNNDEAARARESAEERQLAEGISSRRVQENTDTALAKTPLMSELPYLGEGLEYRIDYGLPASDERAKQGVRAIEISAASPESRKKALDWIRSMGEDPTNYEIIFTDFNGPIKNSGGEVRP